MPPNWYSRSLLIVRWSLSFLPLCQLVTLCMASLTAPALSCLVQKLGVLSVRHELRGAECGSSLLFPDLCTLGITYRQLPWGRPQEGHWPTWQCPVHPTIGDSWCVNTLVCSESWLLKDGKKVLLPREEMLWTVGKKNHQREELTNSGLGKKGYWHIWTGITLENALTWLLRYRQVCELLKIPLDMLDPWDFTKLPHLKLLLAKLNSHTCSCRQDVFQHFISFYLYLDIAQWLLSTVWLWLWWTLYTYG